MPDGQPLNNAMGLDGFDLSDAAISELDAALLGEEPTSSGPMETHLYTEGGEFWLFSSPNADLAQFDPFAGLTEGNSYVGWYHVRNGDSPYQVIVPTQTYEEDYTGELLYTRHAWCLRKGFTIAASQVENHVTIKGCMNPEAFNYNPLATEDDGSCYLVPGYFFGEIPSETMTNLHTSGGELFLEETMDEYKGYYHVHSAGDLPTFGDGTIVSAGMILSGPEFTGWNKVLRPFDINNRFQTFHTYGEEQDGEGGAYKTWNDVGYAAEGDYANIADELNANNPDDIVVDITSAGENKDFIAFNNTVTMPNALYVMADTDYQFNFLLDDESRSPGIYGRKPSMRSNINEIEFSDSNEDLDENGDRTQLPSDVAEQYTDRNSGMGA